jgi:hypothetical protein
MPGVRQVRVHVPGPIALLQAKTANTAELAQAGHQDARHSTAQSRECARYEGAAETDFIQAGEGMLGPVVFPDATLLLQ